MPPKEQPPPPPPVVEVPAEEAPREEDAVPLSNEIVAKGLTELERTMDGTSVALTRLEVPSMKLADISALSRLSHVRHVDVSSNFVRDLSPVYGMKQLLSLHASGNLIETVEFPAMEFLQLLDLSSNSLRGTFTSADMPQLRQLNISNNQLEQITGLNNNPRLQRLEADNNKLSSSEGLGPPSLKVITLHNNQLTEVKGLADLALVTALKLNNNAIVSLEGLPQSGALIKVEAMQNQIANFEEGIQGRVPSSVRELDVSENPIITDGFDRVKVIADVIDLLVLNNVPVTPDERASAKLLLNPPEAADAPAA